MSLMIFFEDVQPIIRLVQRNFLRLIKDDDIFISHNLSAFHDYLKTIPVHVLWDVMNDPELAETIDLDHRETLTWEFCLLHDKNMSDVVNEFATQTSEVRKTIAEYKNIASARPYEECVVVDEKLETIIGMGRKIMSDYFAMKVPLERGNLIAHLMEGQKLRREFFKDVFPILMTQGVEATINNLRDVYWQKVKGQDAPQSKNVTTPSP